METNEEIGLLQSIMTMMEQETGMHMNFDDLTGFSEGFHVDVKPMMLDLQHQTHACDFCEFAKGCSSSDHDCVMNKIAVNRLIVRRRKGLEGWCHLGLFDLAEPLIYRNRVLGIFYYGSVMIKGQEALTRKKISHYCQRQKISVDPFLEVLKTVKTIDSLAIPRYREALHTVVRLAHYFCEATGVKHEAYRNRALKYPYRDPLQLPYVVKEAMQYVASHIHEPFIIKDIAAHLRCHPDFLSRRFKQCTRIELSFYIQQIRVERAKRLLESAKIDVGTAADMSGFSDRVHFSKVFRRVTGLTPGQFQRNTTGDCGKQ